MQLLIVNVLPKNHPEVVKAVCSLTQKVSEYKIFHTEDMKIMPCVGCTHCWLKTPGVCSIKDEYEQLLQAYLQYDAVVFISGTAFGFIDYKMKNIVDRMLPMATMYTRVESGQTRHVPRYEKKFCFGLLYAGDGDGDYLERWMNRFCLNFHGISLGVFPIEAYEEVLLCM